MKNVLEEIMDLMKDAGTRQIETGVPGLSMIKGEIPNHQLAALYEPMIGFTVQGRKILSIGGAVRNWQGHLITCYPCMFLQRRLYIQTMLDIRTCPLVSS